jgi:hypothetical protein
MPRFQALTSRLVAISLPARQDEPLLANWQPEVATGLVRRGTLDSGTGGGGWRVCYAVFAGRQVAASAAEGLYHRA